MAFVPSQLSRINGNLTTAPYQGESRIHTYYTLEDVDTIAALGFFPDSSGLRIGDQVTIVWVDNLDPAHRTWSQTYRLTIEAFS